MCTSDASRIDLACVESFKESNCFPYCLALHVRGSGNQPMTLHGAVEWNEGVVMLNRNCGWMGNATSTGGAAFDGRKSLIMLPESKFGVNAQAENGPCNYQPGAVSMVPRSESAEYAGYDSIELGCLSTNENTCQPFAFAGDVALVAQRAVGGSGWTIQVQRVFGAANNEFTVVPLPQRIPSSGPCSTPRDCGSYVESCEGPSGCLAAIPYSFDQSPRAHVPAVSTDKHTFWITNPTMQPFEAAAFYCHNAALNLTYTNKLQISVLSSYGGIRLWRIEPYLYCPLINGRRLCPNVQTAGGVQLQPLNFTGFDIDLCTQEFAVMATGMDYLNEWNLAVTVLRTSLSNLDTVTLLPLNASLSRYATLFVNPLTLEFREDKLWAPEAASPALQSGQLCPSQRTTPNVGSMLAEAAVSITLAIELPLNVVVGLPVVMPLLSNQCPLMNRGHSMLRSCGAELLSLDDFFDAVYRCNARFWQSLEIVADAFGPGMAQTLINGMSTAGENGAFAAAISPGIIQQMGAVSGIDPLAAAKSLQSTVAALPGPVLLFQSMLKNPISNAHFYYILGSRLFMRLMQSSQGTITVANAFWTTVADAGPEHNRLVLQKMRETCGGIGIMAGPTSPLGILTTRWCSAIPAMQGAFHTMSAVFFVDMPLIACVCKRSYGSNFVRYVNEACWPDAPATYKPLLLSLIILHGDDPTAVCEALVAMTKAEFTEAFNPVFDTISTGTDQLASVLDSFVAAVDPKAGQCNNFVNNPYTMALIPQPVDYFRICGTTDICRSRCRAEFEAFDAANVLPPTIETSIQSVQSLFFNADNTDALTPLSPFALLELTDCEKICGTVQVIRGHSDRCFIVAGEAKNSKLQVLGFCVPIEVGASVRRGGEFTIANGVQGATGYAFAWRPGSADFWGQFQLIAVTPDGLWACHDQCEELVTASELGADVLRLNRIQPVGNLILIEAQYADGATSFSSKPRVYCLTFMGMYSWVGPAECPRSNVWPQADYSHLVCQVSLSTPIVARRHEFS